MFSHGKLLPPRPSYEKLPRLTEESHADGRTERDADTDRARNPDGGCVPPLLDARAPIARVARAELPAGTAQAIGRGLRRVPRLGGSRGHRRAPLSASRRQPVLRSQRGLRAALCLSRLEVRHSGAVRRHSERDANSRRAPEAEGDDSRAQDSRGGRGGLGVLRRDRGCAAGSGFRIRRGTGNAPFRRQETAAVQLGAGLRGWSRHGALLLPACRHQRGSQGRAAPSWSRLIGVRQRHRRAAAAQASALAHRGWGAAFHGLGSRRRPAALRGAHRGRRSTLLAHDSVPDAESLAHARRLPGGHSARQHLGAH